MFVTSQGSPHARFRRALGRGEPMHALAAAEELPALTLSDSLELCLLLARAEDRRYPRFAARWLSLLARSGADLSDLQLAGGALSKVGQQPEDELSLAALRSMAMRRR